MLSFPVLRSDLIIRKCLKFGCAFSTPNVVRTAVANKHWNPKWKKFRTLKVIKVDLPDFHKNEKSFTEFTPEEKRSFYKENGIQPTRPWNEKPFSVDSSPGVIDEYIPPEGDGKLSALNTAGAKQKLEWLKKKSRSWKDLRRIRRYDEEFELYPDFVDKAQEIYIKAHEALARNAKEDLIKYVTEKAYPIMLFNCDRKTIRWDFIKSVEPPRVCHVRAVEILTNYNVFGQITVRFHTQQTLAVYDRFGRLMYGSESVGKDVLEYVVFEKHLASHYGEWRLHHKIIPDWIGNQSPSHRTYVETEEDDQEEAESANTFVTVPQL